MEQVLVVERSALEARLATGEVFITRGIDAICDFILENHAFAPRESAEYDRSLKQIIPYVVIRQAGRFFLMKRLKKQTEERLHDRLSLGVGGHINPEECVAEGWSVLEAGLYRELREEVFVEEIQALRCVGILNENNGGVSDFHMGLVYLLEAKGAVFVRETGKMTGEFAALEEISSRFSDLETWSQIVAAHVLPGLE